MTKTIQDKIKFISLKNKKLPKKHINNLKLKRFRNLRIHNQKHLPNKKLIKLKFLKNNPLKIKCQKQLNKSKFRINKKGKKSFKNRKKHNEVPE